ncbi:hypothetical protein CPB85DRAFT_1255606 [Mucidula mucida]|nr:hypothetical protein CPB85DRAFT_1255606 [Mucidula mucida]
MKLKTSDDWLFFDLLLSKNYSPLYDIRAFYMIYKRMIRSQIETTVYLERILRFIERNDLEELHLGVLDSGFGPGMITRNTLPPLRRIGGVRTLELGVRLTKEWEAHDTSLWSCTQTLANIAQTSSSLGSLTLTFQFGSQWDYIQMPSTRSQCWDLDRALLELDLEELLLVFSLRFVHRGWYWDISWLDDSDEIQMKSEIQTWFLETHLPESGKRYFGCDDPLENIGTFSFEWRESAATSSSMIIILEAPYL